MAAPSATPLIRPSVATTLEVELNVEPSVLTLPSLDVLLDKLAADGVTTISTAANWSALQPQSDRLPSWSQLDRLVDHARARGLKVRLRLGTTPAWLHPERVAGVPAAEAQWYPPVSDAELARWQQFVTEVVTRYGGRLFGVETWNEPNEDMFWKPSPEPTQFAGVLRATYLAVKAVQPALPVTSGGISHNDVGFLRQVYTALKAYYPDAANQNWFFDILGVHPYSGDRSPDETTPKVTHAGRFGLIDENFSGMTLMRDAMAEAGDPGKKLWISEYGFSTDGTPWSGPVADDRRALFLLRAFNRLDASGQVVGLGWYHSYPTPWDAPGYDILGPDLQETVTYKALKQVTGVAPRLRLSVPVAVGSTLRGVLQISGRTFSGVSSMTHAELYANGRLVATGNSSGVTWNSGELSNGAYTLLLAAYSSDGKTWSSRPVGVTIHN
jgi:hypothetical protein